MRLVSPTLLKAALATVAVDQFSKFVVVDALNLRSVGHIDIVPPWLTFRMAWNEGVNFGLFAHDATVMRWVLIGVAAVISAFVLAWVRKEPRNWKAQAAAGLLVGGALGNVIDRLIYGAVADFLNMSCCGIENPFAFNIADIAIFAGALGLILWTDKAKTG